MKFEPVLDRGRLIATVRDAYGLPITEMRFVPAGEVAICYVLSCGDNARHFLKLWSDTDAGRRSAARRDVYLPLTRALYDRGLLQRLSYPLLARDGALWADFDGLPLAVFPFLPGTPLPLDVVEWPDALVVALARDVATLHRATAALHDLLPPRETFAIPFEDELVRALAEVERIGPRDRPGLRALRRLLEPRRDEIAGLLARLHHLQAVVRELQESFVVCHTDLGGHNTLVDAGAHLYLLDWDDVILAPPEHDVQTAAGGAFARFVWGYRENGGAWPLRIEHFAFYLLRRHLGDATMRVLRENTSDEQDEDALYGIEAYGIAMWAALDATLGEMREALEQGDSAA